MSETIRVLLVDDHAVLRGGLKALLNLEADLDVAGEAPQVRRRWSSPAPSAPM
jgi:DNA-binding NarL/FixJ family response regulator